MTALVVDTSALLVDLVAHTSPRWGEVSWHRSGNVSAARRGRLLVEIHHGDGSPVSPAWRLKVYSDTGALLAVVDPSSREVWGSKIPALMAELIARLPGPELVQP